MSMVASIVVTVGTAAAKWLAAASMKDHDGAISLTGEVIDVVKAKINDYMSQREISRSFERVAEKIGEKLQPLVKAEIRKSVAYDVVLKVAADAIVPQPPRADFF